MASKFDEFRADIVTILLSTRSNDPWTAQRIAVSLGIELKTKTEVKRFTRYISGIRKFADPGDPLSVVGNEGRGYFYPEYKDEAERLKLRMANIGNGFYNSAKKYEAHKANAKFRGEQITIDDLGVNTDERKDGSA